MRLTLEKAKELMNHAASVMEGKENFLRHSTSVGDTAAVIAEAAGLEAPDYARALGYVHDVGKHLCEIIQNMSALLNMCHLSSAETQRNLNFISLRDELLGVVHFCIQVIRIDVR